MFATALVLLGMALAGSLPALAWEASDLLVQGTIREISGKSVAGATVSAVGSIARSSAVTDDNGHFLLRFSPQRVRLGQAVRIRVEAEGYAPVDRDIQIKAVSQVEDFKLKHTPGPLFTYEGSGRSNSSIKQGMAAPRTRDTTRTVVASQPDCWGVAIKYEDPLDRWLAEGLSKYISAHPQLKVQSIDLLSSRLPYTATAEIRYYRDTTSSGPAFMLQEIVRERIALLGRSQVVKSIQVERDPETSGVSLELYIPRAIERNAVLPTNDQLRRQNASITVSIIPHERALRMNDPCIETAIEFLRRSGYRVEDFRGGYPISLSGTSIQRFVPDLTHRNAVYYYYADYRSKAIEIQAILSPWIESSSVYFLSGAILPGESSLTFERLLTLRPDIRIQVNIGR